ncbi:MAG: ABC-F family ATP-binding cassette domain-containing protein [Bifidobacteriaceae bacterium]|jgi:ATPase subunit of ABC transporter with duplicated ATPase domains|nr:ABC-F family ATP-binding cassette domain-containing protein [Bifidobacteriaceae bacterium]
MAHLIGAEAISISFTGDPVLQDVSLGLAEGDRIGIVGRNGEGKSTLMALLAGTLEPDQGRVTMRAGIQVGGLDQADDLPSGASLRQVVVGDQPDHLWATRPRAREVINALIGDLDLAQPVDQLSGGQRRRAALAAVLIQDWDVLFLDEPTNHLDMNAIAWLAEHLKTRWPDRRGALALVTHDRWFLDQVSASTWEVHDARVEPFEGGYGAYVLQRVERDAQQAASAARRRNVLRKELAWLRRGAPARTSKPKFRLDAAAALIADVPEPRDTVQLKRLAMNRLGKDVLELTDVTLGYGGEPVIRGADWIIGPGDRLGILGANGAGKTTLLKGLAGQLPPAGGRVGRGKTVRLAWLSQSMMELDSLADQRILDILETLRASYQAGGRRAGAWTGGGRDAKAGWTSGAEEMTPTALLERLGFTAAQFATPVRDLSGGQRRRLQLALTLLEEPNVLILDEPTNDLDTDMLAAIEDLLDSWPGTLLVVTHDRYLMERVTDQQFALVDGELRHLPGGVDQYLRLSAAEPPAKAGLAPANAPSGGTGLSGAELRAVRKELASAERRVEKLTARIGAARAALAGHDPSDYLSLNAEVERIAGMEAELGALEDRWYELSELAG